MAQLPHDLSPLEMLEQRSRRLATRLHDTPTPKSMPRQHPADSLRHQQQTEQNGEKSTSLETDPENSTAGHTSEYNQASAERFSRSSRTNSTASLASLGGSILGDFRLSTFSILNNSNNYSSSSLVADSSDRNSIYEPPQLAQPPVSPQQQRMTHYRTDSTSTLTPVQSYRTPLTPSSSRDRYSGLTSSSSPAAEQRRSISYSRLSSSTGSVSSSHGQRPSISTLSSQTSHTISPVSSAGDPNGADFDNAMSTRRSISQESPYMRAASGSSSDNIKQQPQKGLSSESEFEILRTKSLNNSLTLEEHVSLGIYYHESGNLREASYHWQNASFHGDTTGMLLYGLALRHGWGIKQNPVEAFKWLRKAIGPAIENESFEAALKNDLGQTLQDKLLAKDLTSATSGGAPGQNKFKKARIAAAMYELGMCYLNSWGTEKDEEMALRCFELAGNMGDCDALCEAASLWMKNGPKGRKKDLQRAAKLYRTAGEKGANMVSNSWIYKDKYMGDEAKDKKKKR